MDNTDELYVMQCVIRCMRAFFFGFIAVVLMACAAPKETPCQASDCAEARTEKPHVADGVYLRALTPGAKWMRAGELTQTPRPAETAPVWRVQENLPQGEYQLRVVADQQEWVIDPEHPKAGVLIQANVPNASAGANSASQKQGFNQNSRADSGDSEPNDFPYGTLVFPAAGPYRLEFDVQSQDSTFSVQSLFTGHTRHKKIAQHTPDASSSVSISVNREDYRLRRYAHSSSTAGVKGVIYEEREEDVRLRSGDITLDALFSGAIESLRQQKRKGSKGSCTSCYELDGNINAALWELAMASKLSLALIDNNAVEALLEELFARIASNTQQEFNDQQMLMWMMIADEFSLYLNASQKNDFAKKHYETVAGFIEHARDTAFVGREGVYYSERLGLWYGPLIDQQLERSAELHCNMLHFIGLRLVSNLAQWANDPAMAIKYQDWAADLRYAIRRTFSSDVAVQSFNAEILKDSQADVNSQSPRPLFNTAAADGAAFELGAQWMALRERVIAPSDSAAMLDNLQVLLSAHVTEESIGSPLFIGNPSGLAFANVRALQGYATLLDSAWLIERQGIFPRVSAIEFKQLEAAYAQIWQTMMHTAAQPVFLQTSRRMPSTKALRKLGLVQSSLVGSSIQAAAVLRGIFGIRVNHEGVAFVPAITHAVDLHWLPQQGNNREIHLYQLRLRGKAIDVHIELPAALPSPTANPGVNDYRYPVLSTQLNGREIRGAIAFSQLEANNDVRIRLGRLRDDAKPAMSGLSVLSNLE